MKKNGGLHVLFWVTLLRGNIVIPALSILTGKRRNQNQIWRVNMGIFLFIVGSDYYDPSRSTGSFKYTAKNPLSGRCPRRVLEIDPEI